MAAARTTRVNGRLRRGVSLETDIGIGATLLAIVAMAVDHLMGDDPGLEDPPAFAIAVGLSLALAAFFFWRVVPRAIAAGREARVGLICSAIAIVPGVTTIWLGLPFVLAGAGLALGLHGRERGSDRRAVAAIVIGALALVGGAVVYIVEGIDKLA